MTTCLQHLELASRRTQAPDFAVRTVCTGFFEHMFAFAPYFDWAKHSLDEAQKKKLIDNVSKLLFELIGRNLIHWPVLRVTSKAFARLIGKRGTRDIPNMGDVGMYMEEVQTVALRSYASMDTCDMRCAWAEVSRISTLDTPHLLSSITVRTNHHRPTV